MPRQYTTYIVYRHGSNAANQSMTLVAPVGFEIAPDREQAKEQMAKRTTVYNNQYLSAKPASRASASDWDTANYAEYSRKVAKSGDQFRY